MSPPAGYQRLATGVRCRCPNLWTDGHGAYWCCQPAEPVTIHALPGCLDAPFGPEMQALLARLDSKSNNQNNQP